MALNLTVPAFTDEPLPQAETHPQKLAEFIASLPPAPLDAAIALHEEIEILNRQRVAADSRYKALELYRDKLTELSGTLAATYCGTSLPLTKAARASAAAAESLWLELSYGYKLVLIEHLSQLFTLAHKGTIPIIHRALDALLQLSMVYYQTYFDIPETVWRDIHQLYFHAAQQSIHQLPIINDGKASSIELLYKQILLLALSDPRHMSAQDLQLVADYSAQHAQHAQLRGLGKPENSAGIFIVDLSSAKAPTPYAKAAKAANADTDILFVTIELVRLIHQQLQQLLQDGKQPQQLNLPAIAANPRYQDMLSYLIRHWGISPRRSYRRSHKTSIYQLGIGLDAIHAMLEQERQTEHETKTAAESNAAISNWQVINISAEGTALRKFPTVTAQVDIGDLLAVRGKGERRWSIAALRWATNRDHEQLEIGTQLLAPQAQPVSISAVNSGKFEPALSLPAVAATRQAATLATRCGIYAPARVLEINENGMISKVMITKLVERSRNYERFQFSAL